MINQQESRQSRFTDSNRDNYNQFSLRQQQSYESEYDRQFFQNFCSYRQNFQSSYNSFNQFSRQSYDLNAYSD